MPGLQASKPPCAGSPNTCDTGAQMTPPGFSSGFGPARPTLPWKDGMPPSGPAADAPVVAAVRSALDNQAEGKRCAARGDAAGAAAAYRRVVDDLLRAQPLYAASPANQAAVARALPGVDLAAETPVPFLDLNELRGEGVHAVLAVRNLLDARYVASRRPAGLRPGLPRTVLIGIRAEF